MTQKTAEQVKQAQADAFEYGMGKFLRKTGLVKTAEDVQAFLKIAAEAAQNTATWDTLRSGLLAGGRHLMGKSTGATKAEQLGRGLKVLGDQTAPLVPKQVRKALTPQTPQPSLLEQLKTLSALQKAGLGAGALGLAGAGGYGLSRLLGGGSAEEEEEEA